MNPLRAIRAHCMECANTAPEVRLCNLTKCPLHPFRFGTNPYRQARVLTEEQKSQLAARLTGALSAPPYTTGRQRQENPNG